MKQMVINYIFNVVIALCLLALGSFFVSQAKDFYHSYADITNFFEVGEMTAFDVCVGDEYQNILSGRVVKGTDVGYHAKVTRELNKIGFGKVYEETAYPFAEVSNNGDSTRIQKLPADLEPGEYQWILYITLDIYGIDREVIPPMKSNIFNILPIEDCNLDTL